jgi:uncharacterized repeat protein (TIGR01451 family)
MNARHTSLAGNNFIGALYRTILVCGLFLLLPAAVHATVVVTALPISTIENNAFSGPVATFTSNDPTQNAVNYTASINWGDGTTTPASTITGPAAGVFTVTGGHTYAEDGLYTLTVTVTDSVDATTVPRSIQINVGESVLTMSALGPFSVAEGTAFNGALATFSDPGSTDPVASFTATIDWGDGTTTPGTITGSNGAYSISGAHTYADERSFSATVTAFENSNPTFSISISVSMTVTEADVLVGTPVNFSVRQSVAFSGPVATFTDTYTGNVAADFTATILWGDATTSAGVVSGGGASYTVSGNHTYANFGVFTVTVTLSDDAPGTATATTTSTATVIAAPVITKIFGAASIPLNGSTSLSVTVQNSNTTVALTGIAFTDTLPAGLVVATPNGLTNTCGGTATATAGLGSLSLSGGTVATSATCAVTINVTGITTGNWVNTTSTVTSANGGTGSTASASIAVVTPPTIAKSFAPSTIPAGGTTTLTFTLTNPAANTVALTGVAFTDVLPAFLMVSAGSSSACGGTLTTSAPGTITLSGGSIAVGGQCQFSVTVFAVGSGDFNNTTGAVTSSNGGTGGTASARLTVLPPLLIPTLSGWALALLAAMLAFATLPYMRRRQG